MCISNCNRRPFPTNGFKSHGAALVSTMSSSSIATEALKNALKASSTSATVKHHHPHIVVQHNYHDHANDSCVNYQESQPARGGVTTPFPLKLHNVLEQVVEDGHDHIVSWQPHGRCFVVHDSKKFTELLPHYFKLSKLASFQRQLNLYGFQRITRGRDRGGYYHELFLKGRVFLAHSIQRVKVKGTGVRARSNPEQEPNFWRMPWVEHSSSSQSSSSSASPAPSSPPQQNEDAAAAHDNTGLPALFFSQQFPLHLEPTTLPSEDEVLFGKHFFGVDQESNSNLVRQESLSSSSVQQMIQDQPLLAEEVDAFFEDFDFPDDIGNEIEDDAVFGDLLEQIIS